MDKEIRNVGEGIASVISASIFSNMEQQQTVATILLDQLASWGVKHIYGVAGDANLGLLQALQQQDHITFFPVGMESYAAMMASTEGKCTNKIGVCLGTSGPGLTNMLNGIADAAADQVPVLVITGQVERKKVGTQAKQYIDQQQMISPLAVYSAIVQHPDAAVEIIKRALIEALSKKGVAHVSIPKDLWEQPCNRRFQPPVGVLWNSKQEGLNQLDKAVMYLVQAKQPILLIGAGARGVTDWILKLSEVLQAGIIESLGAKGVVPYHHPFNIGGIGEGGTLESRDILMLADCILVIGANWWPDGFVPQQSKVIGIDLSPSSIEGHTQVKYGIVGDVKQILPILYQRITQHLQNNPMDRNSWQQRITEAKQKITKQHQTERESDTSPIRPQRVIAAIDETVNPDAIMVVDTGDHTIWFNRIFRAKQQEVLFSGRWRTMGFGLPGAIAAKINYPDKQVVTIIGDGCLQMSCMELATVAKLNIPITMVILNNDSLAMEEHKMESKGSQPYGVRLHNPDFALLAQSFGVKGVRVTDAKEWDHAFVEAIHGDEPVLLDVRVAHIMPPLTGFADKLIQ